MLSLPKIAVLSLVIIAIGALQFAVPTFTHKQTALPILDPIGSQTALPNSALINQPVSDYQNRPKWYVIFYS